MHLVCLGTGGAARAQQMTLPNEGVSFLRPQAADSVGQCVHMLIGSPHPDAGTPTITSRFSLTVIQHSPVAVPRLGPMGRK